MHGKRGKRGMPKPKPDQVTALLIALPMLIITKSEMIYTKIPKPISLIKSDSM